MMDIASIIKELAKGGRNIPLVCKVDVVDKESRTVDCSPINEDAPLLGVNLQANQNSSFGVVCFPRVDSYIVVGFIAEGSAGVVLLMDDIESAEIVISKETTRIKADENGATLHVGEKVNAEMTKDRIFLDGGDGMTAEIKSSGIILNGGNFGGLVKVEDVTKRFNLIEKDINKLKQALATWIPTPNDGGAALKGAIGSWFGSRLVETKRKDYENEKVKQ